MARHRAAPAQTAAKISAGWAGQAAARELLHARGGTLRPAREPPARPQSARVKMERGRRRPRLPAMPRGEGWACRGAGRLGGKGGAGLAVCCYWGGQILSTSPTAGGGNAPPRAHSGPCSPSKPLARIPDRPMHFRGLYGPFWAVFAKKTPPNHKNGIAKPYKWHYTTL